MSFIPILIFFVLATISVFTNTFVGDKQFVFYLYTLACGIELLAEPFYSYCQFKLLYDVRVGIESRAFVAQIVSTLVLSTMKLKESRLNVTDGLYIYGYSQVIYSAVLLAQYSRVKMDVSVIPRKSPTWLDIEIINISLGFVFQSIIKHVLTVGDKIVLVWLGIKDESKGSYRLVSDLGSLVCRMLFLPLEEISRAYFSKSNEKQKKECQEFLETLLQFHYIFGSYFVFFATNYTQLLLKILYSKSDAGDLLSLYCLYVPIMGINGITESFVQAAGDTKLLAKQSLYFIYFWIAFIFTSYVTMNLLDMGSFGLVISNMINMLLRIQFSMNFINQKLRVDSRPKAMLVVVYFGCWLVTFSTKQYLVYHLVSGMLCFALTLYVL
ncbi:Oligosaccharide translocation protein rft1 [Boothiomyces macroporosus]|uniref:Man(5)GlcNAc(2)-PP-dolichol translocation protein RFT1 n=1 Tax=Boothiomyces macroporosus TaxID=261099 RepID=A0AAD5UJ97_9FUNG|nr:Oligosaccharide translocation protein rft1 [Boothiomyces macroporosus]